MSVNVGRLLMNEALADEVLRGVAPADASNDGAFEAGDSAVGLLAVLARFSGLPDGRSTAAVHELRRVAAVAAWELSRCSGGAFGALLVGLLSLARTSMRGPEWHALVGHLNRVQRGVPVDSNLVSWIPYTEETLGVTIGRNINGLRMLVCEVMLWLDFETKMGRRSLRTLDGSAARVNMWAAAIEEWLHVDLFGPGESRLMRFISDDGSLVYFRERVLRYFEAKEGRLVEMAFRHELRKELRQILKAMAPRARRRR